MSKSNYYEHVKDCLEGVRNRRFCAGAESGAAEIKRLTVALGLATAENERLRIALNMFRWPIELRAAWNRTIPEVEGAFQMLLYWATQDKDCISTERLALYKKHMEYVQEYHSGEIESAGESNHIDRDFELQQEYPPDQDSVPDKQRETVGDSGNG